jgi:geranylgeranyl transferase type-1 subunit beta
MLNRYCVIDDARNRQYLLEKTQHLVGGFGKGVGDPPGKVKCFLQRQFNTDQIVQISFILISAWSHLRSKARPDLLGLILLWLRPSGLLST